MLQQLSAKRDRFNADLAAKQAEEQGKLGSLADTVKCYNHKGMDLHGPSLEGHLRRRRRGIPIAQIARVAHQVAVGLTGLSDHGLVHTDIKPSNILLATAFAADDADVRIADLGGCYDQRRRRSPGTGRFSYTAMYSPPEQVLHGGDQRRHVPDFVPTASACHAWALGCVLYELYAGEALFEGMEDPLDHLHRMQRLHDFGWGRPYNLCHQMRPAKNAFVDERTGELHPLLFPRGRVGPARPFRSLASVADEALRDLLARLLQLDPAQRYDPRDVPSHPFVRQHQLQSHCQQRRPFANGCRHPVTESTTVHPPSPHTARRARAHEPLFFLL
jgi:serine/threonine protein kinase